MRFEVVWSFVWVFGTSLVLEQSDLSGIVVGLVGNNNARVWVALDFTASVSLFHTLDKCPTFIDCVDLTSQPLTWDDSSLLVNWEPFKQRPPLPLYSDVVGVLALGPLSAVAQTHRIHISRRGENVLMKFDDSTPSKTGARIHLWSIGEGWRLATGALTVTGWVREVRIQSSVQTISIDLTSGDVVVPSRNAERLVSGHTKVLGNRLFVTCKPGHPQVFRFLIGSSFDPVFVGVRAIEENGKWCATNVRFSDSEQIMIGRSCLDFHDVELDGNKGWIRFLPKRIREGPDPVKAAFFPGVHRFAMGYRVDASLKHGGWTWLAAKRNERSPMDWILVSRWPPTDLRFELFPLAGLDGMAVSEFVPQGAGTRWTGAPALSMDMRGNIVVKEDRTSHQLFELEVTIHESSGTVSVKFLDNGRRFFWDRELSQDGVRLVASHAVGEDRMDGEFLVHSWPPVLRQVGKLYILPGQFQDCQVAGVWFRSPVLSVDENERLVITASGEALETPLVIRERSDMHDRKMFVFDPEIGRFECVWDGNGGDLVFRRLGPSETRSTSELAMDYKLNRNGENVHYWIDLVALNSNQFSCLDDMRWTGRPEMYVDPENGDMIIRSSDDSCFDLTVRKTVSGYTIHFDVCRGRFLVSPDARVDGNLMTFAPVRGAPVEREFFVNEDNFIRRKDNGGFVVCLDHVFSDTLFGTPGVWNGQPVAEVNAGGELELRAHFWGTKYRVTESVQGTSIILHFDPID